MRKNAKFRRAGAAKSVYTGEPVVLDMRTLLDRTFLLPPWPWRSGRFGKNFAAGVMATQHIKGFLLYC